MSSDLFQPRSDQDVLRLLREQPFGWLICGHGETFRATRLPFRPRLGQRARSSASGATSPDPIPRSSR